jgi:hypothetical protein
MAFSGAVVAATTVRAILIVVVTSWITAHPSIGFLWGSAGRSRTVYEKVADHPDKICGRSARRLYQRSRAARI